jgi:hypothetical protein
MFAARCKLGGCHASNVAGDMSKGQNLWVVGSFSVTIERGRRDRDFPSEWHFSMAGDYPANPRSTTYHRGRPNVRTPPVTSCDAAFFVGCGFH